MSENPWAARTPAPSAKATLLAIVEILTEAEAEEVLALLEDEGMATTGSV